VPTQSAIPEQSSIPAYPQGCGPVRSQPHPPCNSVHEMCALAKRYAIEVGSTIVFLAFVLKTVGRSWRIVGGKGERMPGRPAR
jgi:hypothetical protein